MAPNPTKTSSQCLDKTVSLWYIKFKWFFDPIANGRKEVKGDRIFTGIRA